MLRLMRKTLRLFDRAEKRKLLLLLGVVLFSSVLEGLGVSVLVSVVYVMMRTDAGAVGGTAGRVASILGIHGGGKDAVRGLVLLILLTAVKTWIIFYRYRMQYRFLYRNRFRTQRTLLHTFLSRPYERSLGARSGTILRELSGDVNQVFSLVQYLLYFVIDVLTAAVLTAAVFLISPGITLFVVCLMGGTVAFFTLTFRKRQRRHGRERNRAVSAMNKWLIQAVRGIREIKIMGRESYFEENYGRCAEKCERIDRVQAELSMMPRVFTEAVSVTVMLSAMALLLSFGMSADRLIPELSAFAMAAVKLMPAANRIVNSINQAAFGMDSLENVFRWLDEAKRAPETGLRKQEEPLPFRKEIAFRGVTYHYPEGNGDVLRGAEFTVPKGACVGIVGTSGAGKTTAVDILVGLLSPKEGAVTLDGEDVSRQYEGWLAHIGYIPQSIFILDDTIEANVAFGRAPGERDRDRVIQALADAQLAEFVRGLPDGLETQVGEAGIRLSGGQRQRIGIARALYEHRDVLIFDEATSALDLAMEKEIMDSVYSLRGRKTMIIISHRLQTIDRCDLVYEVKDGEIRRVRGQRPDGGREGSA